MTFSQTLTFEEALARVKTLSRAPDAATLLRLYALFKQATEADAVSERPGALDLRARAKFDAWSALAGVSAEQAKADYASLVAELLEKDAA